MLTAAESSINNQTVGAFRSSEGPAIFMSQSIYISTLLQQLNTFPSIVKLKLFLSLGTELYLKSDFLVNTNEQIPEETMMQINSFFTDLYKNQLKDWKKIKHLETDFQDEMEESLKDMDLHELFFTFIKSAKYLINHHSLESTETLKTLSRMHDIKKDYNADNMRELFEDMNQILSSKRKPKKK